MLFVVNTGYAIHGITTAISHRIVLARFGDQNVTDLLNQIRFTDTGIILSSSHRATIVADIADVHAARARLPCDRSLVQSLAEN
jgi:hypothetical protein